MQSENNSKNTNDDLNDKENPISTDLKEPVHSKNIRETVVSDPITKITIGNF
jgi:hypothetical protein